MLNNNTGKNSNSAVEETCRYHLYQVIKANISICMQNSQKLGSNLSSNGTKRYPRPPNEVTIVAMVLLGGKVHSLNLIMKKYQTKSN